MNEQRPFGSDAGQNRGSLGMGGYAPPAVMGGGPAGPGREGPGLPQGTAGGVDIYNPALQPGGGFTIGGQQRGGQSGTTPSGGGGNFGSVGSMNGAGLGQSYGGGGGGGGRPSQGSPAETLLAAQEKNNAANESRFQELKGLNTNFGNQAQGDLNQSYGTLMGMPGMQRQQQMDFLQNNTNQLQAQNQANAQQAQDINKSNQQGLQGAIGGAKKEEMGYLQKGFGGLQDMAGQQKQEQMGFLGQSYGNLANQAQGNQNQQMGFLGQQDQRSRGILNQFSNSEVSREEQSRKNQLGTLAQQMQDRGLGGTGVDIPEQRRINDDSQRRIAEIGDMRAGRELGVADAYAGRGVGVLGQTGAQQLGIGQNYANAGINSLTGSNQSQLGLGQAGVNAGYGAMSGLNAFGLGAQQQSGNQGLGIQQQGAQQGMNLGIGGMNAGLGIMGQAGQQELNLGREYAQGRQGLAGDTHRERMGVIERKTENFDPSPYLSMLSQGGASGSVGGGPTLYNGGLTQQGHVGGGGNFGNLDQRFGPMPDYGNSFGDSGNGQDYVGRMQDQFHQGLDRGYMDPWQPPPNQYPYNPYGMGGLPNDPYRMT